MSKPTKITNPVHNDVKVLSNSNSTAKDKEIAAKVLSDRTPVRAKRNSKLSFKVFCPGHLIDWTVF